MGGGQLGEASRVGRDGYGQAQVRGGLAGGRDELVEASGEATMMIRPGLASETVKPCGIARGMNTSEPGPARHRWSPQNPSSWPSRMSSASSLWWWICGGGAKPGGTR